MGASGEGRRPATLEDIARRLNLSVATVGRALGGYGSVASETRRQVLEAAEELNYHPNGLARGMKKQETRTIGMMVANICNPFFSTLVRAVEDTVRGRGYNVIVCNTDEDTAKEMAYARILHERRVDGMIVSPTFNQERKASKAVRHYYAEGVPTVFIDRKVAGVTVPCVRVDNVSGAYEATMRLLRLGHRRIGVIVGKASLTSMEERVDGYRRALAEAGLPYDEALVVDGEDVGVEGGRVAAARLLERREGRPTALFILNQLLTTGALQVLHELGLAVPRDVAVIGWDDFELAPCLPSPLTVVSQPVYAIGAIAAERLLDIIAGRRESGQLEVVLKPELIVRKSCGGNR